ncbi:AI-2E family transporter [Eubacteriales bacterium OttesenSCG-928-N14]|nr:AI-2E family transporter [Eubacteriales bacterium OttesenSCG-928-N14]
MVFFMLRIDSVHASINTFFTALAPFLIGLGIAYLLNRPVQWLYWQIMKIPLFGQKRNYRYARGLAIAAIYVVVGIFVALVAIFILPELVNSIYTIVSRMNDYLADLSAYLRTLLEDFNFAADWIEDFTLTWQQIMSTLFDSFGSIVNTITDALRQITNITINLLLGIIMSVYALYSKDVLIAQGKKLIYAIVPTRFWDATDLLLARSNVVFWNYIGTRVITSLMVAIVYFILLSLLGFPFPPVLSVIILFTNLIPVFGALLGTIICALLLLAIDPSLVLWFILMAIVIQQIDGNIVTPKIMGTRIGMPTLWTMVSVIIGGGLFGIWGMLLGVPVVAVFYAIISTIINMRLQKKQEESGESKVDVESSMGFDSPENKKDHNEDDKPSDKDQERQFRQDLKEDLAKAQEQKEKKNNKKK